VLRKEHKKYTMRKLLLLIALGIASSIAVQAQNLRYFQFNNIDCGHGNWQDTSFIVATSNAALINEVQVELAKPIGERKIISGAIVAGHGGYNHNAGHWFKWHMKENEWALAEMAMEVCDGCPYSDIDADTAYWLNTVKQYCPWSSQPIREVPEPNSVDDVSTEQGLIVYPNPASNMLHFKWEHNNTINVYIINTVGVTVRTANMQRALPSLDISELPDGIYFLKIKDGDRSVSRTIEVKK